MPKNQKTGIIVSDKMLKTVVVSVLSIKENRKYKRRYKTHKKYKAHVDNQDFHVGDKVLIEECKPISKDKNWKVVKKLAEANIISEEGEAEVKG